MIEMKTVIKTAVLVAIFFQHTTSFDVPYPFQGAYYHPQPFFHRAFFAPPFRHDLFVGEVSKTRDSSQEKQQSDVEMGEPSEPSAAVSSAVY